MGKCKLCGYEGIMPQINPVTFRKKFKTTPFDVCKHCYMSAKKKPKNKSRHVHGIVNDCLQHPSVSRVSSAIIEIKKEKVETEDRISKFLKEINRLSKHISYLDQQRDILNNLGSVYPEIDYEVRRRIANNHIQQAKIRAQVFSRDGFTCNHCGTDKDLSIDHIISVRNGGGNELAVTILLCLPSMQQTFFLWKCSWRALL